MRDMNDPAIQKCIDGSLALAHDLGIEGKSAVVIGKVSMAELQSAVADARKTDRLSPS